MTGRFAPRGERGAPAASDEPARPLAVPRRASHGECPQGGMFLSSIQAEGLNISNWEHPPTALPSLLPAAPALAPARPPTKAHIRKPSASQAPQLRNPRFPGRRCRGPPSPPDLPANTTTLRPGQRLDQPPHPTPRPGPGASVPRAFAELRQASPTTDHDLTRPPRSPPSIPPLHLPSRPRLLPDASVLVPAMRPEGSAPRRGHLSPYPRHEAARHLSGPHRPPGVRGGGRAEEEGCALLGGRGRRTGRGLNQEVQPPPPGEKSQHAFSLESVPSSEDACPTRSARHSGRFRRGAGRDTRLPALRGRQSSRGAQTTAALRSNRTRRSAPLTPGNRTAASPASGARTATTSPPRTACHAPSAGTASSIAVRTTWC